MASRKKKSRSIKKKKSYRLTETDLARAATAPAFLRKSLIKSAAGGGGYDHYKGIKTNIGGLLRVALNPLVAASAPTKKQIKAVVARDCIGTVEVEGNQAIAEGLYNYVARHNVTAAEFDFQLVSLGRAGLRRFWVPYILKIDGKKYIPYFDFRQEPRRLDEAARQFVFSVNHSHIRLGDPEQYGDVGFVIFQFDAAKNGERKVVAYFDHGISFWSDQEINAMIDEVYRVLDEIRRAA